MSISFDSFSDALCKSHDVEGRIREQVRNKGWTPLVAAGARQARHDNAIGNTLATMIEGEILPRLLLAHQHPDYYRLPPSKGGPAASPFNPEIFAERTLALSTKELLAELDRHADGGVDWQTICLDLLAPAARVLGVWWEEDKCSFTEVTIGLGRLHQLLHMIVSRATHQRMHTLEARRALFVPSPGEQHVFGLIMLQEFFEADGWIATTDLAASVDDILEAAAAETVDLIGFTVACEEHLEPLPHLIRSVRKASRNPNVAVMVGGRLFPEGSNLAERVGANASAPDGRLAVDVAGALVRTTACAVQNS
jgi:MerR family transcriptional regulator, light-induced transcriptional regulator